MLPDKKIYLILPGCDDTNRGDQALVWETVALAKQAGFKGSYYMLADKQNYHQSAQEQILQMDHILEHPSTRSTKKDNIRYTFALKLRWTLIAIGDIITRSGLLNKFTRKITTAFMGKRVKASLKLFEHADACFVKGGGFLHANGGLSETYKIFYFLYHIRLAQSFGVPVYILPNSFGPFNSPFVKHMLKKVLKRCKISAARESASAQQLSAECGIKAIQSCDLAFFLEDDPHFDPYEFQKSKDLFDSSRKRVAITVRPYRFPEIKNGADAYKSYKNAIVDFSIWLFENGYLPVLVEHVHAENSHEDDMSCIKEILALLKAKGCADKCKVFSERALTCRQMKQIYSTFDYTVGTRFHSVIFSLSSMVPSVAITYGGNKGTGIMHDLGLEDYSIPMQEIHTERLINCFQKLCENDAAIKKLLLQQKAHIQAQKELLLKLLESN